MTLNACCTKPHNDVPDNSKRHEGKWNLTLLQMLYGVNDSNDATHEPKYPPQDIAILDRDNHDPNNTRQAACTKDDCKAGYAAESGLATRSSVG